MITLRAIALCLLLTMPAAASMAQNTPAPPEKPFTLLLITADGGYGNVAPNPLDQHVRKMICAAQTKEMQRWEAWASPKELAANSPIVREHHADIMQRAKALPVLALVDSTSGAVWHVMSGDQIPRSEYDLARTLDVYYAATMEAAKDAPRNAVQTVSRTQWDQFKRSGIKTSGPAPYMPTTSPGGGGILDPLLNIPDGFDINANAGVDASTQAWGIKVSAMILGGLALLAAAIVFAAWIITEGFTDNDQ